MRNTTIRSSRRAAAAVLALTTGLGMAGVAAVSAAAAPLASQTVVAGDARFQVLSPTLIRTEYAADGTFTDDATFNAIGRDGFGPTPFTQEVTNGWLTIDTGSMTLRYREGSGAFDQQNLSVAVTTDAGQHVTGSPWTSAATPSCAVDRLCEAETLALDGLSPATNHTGYTGTGFAAGYEAVGNALTFSTTIGAADAGTRDLVLRYANSQGGDGQVTTRTLSVVVDDQPARTISLPNGANWDDWRTTATALDLTAGTHRITIERAAGDSGQVNVDSLALVPTGAALPAPTPTTAGTDCAFGTICQGEDLGRTGNATAAKDHNGYAGTGFASGLWGTGSGLTAHVTDVPTTGDYTLQVRYANALAASPTLTATTAGVGTTVALPPTSGWDYWNTVAVPVHLTAGADDVILGCPTEANNCNVNIDTVAAVAADSPVLAPHAALGGYRRDLDTANGTVSTNPGLLYQDGWSLLDDSASALYDTTTKAVRPRPAGGDSQDGYVFGYGNHFTTALHDLAVLTGPTKLLPRWAYGVWYSEYYDRSQADYSAIAKEFKQQGVPVDVMAIDTDYKLGSKWNGWEVDPARIPDMSALLAEWHAEGIHNTLNIHPTISGTDPKFPEAQATADGKLTKSGDDYLFDWSDPDQLQAYLDLHRDFRQDGADSFWLDWCCSENSKYSANGVTPDAFINQQYAQYTNQALGGRGFAFSRAYGSLTAGGYGNPQAVPTGPWTDKRTTLHFTGDTTSSWDMLAAEVGYTPGESASTGLAAISHDIGGHNGAQYGITGAEPGSTQLPPDLYARWVQLGAFQPIDRLHSNHSDRLPWQYPAVADASASKFLDLREDLVPLTYTLAADATATGTPIVQPLYLQYPDQPESYSRAGAEYLYGPDVLVAPVTTAGETATTNVWFPAGSSWTDWFTGTTYQGGTTAAVTTNLQAMPVFVRSGGIVPTRTDHVANDSAPLDAATLTVATGADGSFTLHEDAGEDTTSTGEATPGSATTAVRYTQQPTGGMLDIAPADGSFAGQVQSRAWTATFTDADQPTAVEVDGERVPATAWSYDSATRTVSVPVASRSVTARTTVSFTTAAIAAPQLQVGSSTIAAGATQTVTGTGFPSSTDVVLTTTPDVGGTSVRTDADGAFTAALPVSASASGAVDVIASVGGTEAARASFTVTASAGAAPGNGGGAGTPGSGAGVTPGGTGGGATADDPDRSGRLAFTGSDLVPIGLLAAALLAAGGVLLRIRRRRSR
ncbi:TIM-barrel domain-containing protein [Curtobacterium sp. RRHDQ10]|uniref:TIM-barrel domain-containing protein n=1 Tax=Curtobacterium phyllosphaerae TaxID=3413379 RepID=UPI003BF2F9EB